MSSAGLSSWIYASFRRTKRRFQGLQRTPRYSFEPLDGPGGVSSAKSALLPSVAAAASSPSPRDSLEVDEDDDVGGGISNRGENGVGDTGSRPDSVVDASSAGIGGAASISKADGDAEMSTTTIKYDAMMESEPSSPTAVASSPAAATTPDSVKASSPTSSTEKSPFRKRGSKPFLSLRKKKKSESTTSPPVAPGRKKKGDKNASAASTAAAISTPTPSIQEDLLKAKEEELDRLRQETTALKMELRKSEENFKRLAQREKILQDRLAAQALHVLEKSGKFENINSTELRPSQIVTMFQELYSQGRVDAIDALDELEELEDFDDLKTKILYSVIVLAHRAAKRTLDNLKSAVRTELQLPDASSNADDDGEDVNEPEALLDRSRNDADSNPLLDTASAPMGETAAAAATAKTTSTTTQHRRWHGLARGVDDVISDWLRKTSTAFELTSCLEEVEEQLHATLYDFPSLKGCVPLREFIVSAIRVSWCCAVQNPAFTLEYQQTEFKTEIHQRFITADPDQPEISSYVWPGLFDGNENGACLVRGVVIT